MNLSRSYSYSRVSKEDPDEMKHRRAQFLINREMQRADSIRQRKVNPRLVISKLKIKVGFRIKRLRKAVNYTISVVRSKSCIYRKLLVQLKLWKKGITGGKDADNVMMLAPFFALDVNFEASDYP